jgi:hypothetical protein
MHASFQEFLRRKVEGANRKDRNRIRGEDHRDALKIDHER